MADRLTKHKEKPTQKYTDPTSSGQCYTLLHKAVEVGSQPIAAALLKAGADANATDNNQATPLHWSALHSKDSQCKIAGQ